MAAKKKATKKQLAALKKARAARKRGKKGRKPRTYGSRFIGPIEPGGHRKRRKKAAKKGGKKKKAAKKAAQSRSVTARLDAILKQLSQRTRKSKGVSNRSERRRARHGRRLASGPLAPPGMGSW